MTDKDLSILRTLAEKKLELSQDPVNRERRDAWYGLDAGDPGCRPIILAGTLDTYLWATNL